MAAAVFFPQSVGGGAEHFSIVSKRAQGRPKRGREKTVTWPTEDKMCQVLLFFSDEAPSTLGSTVQDFLQSNHPRYFLARDMLLNEESDLPPGFHGSMAKRARVDSVTDALMVIEKPWCHPQKFFLDGSWWVAEGGESSEAAVQQQREIRVLEAFYPRLTSIPDSPAEPQESCKHIGDTLTPQIPLIPVEDEDENSEEGECERKTPKEDCLSYVSKSGACKAAPNFCGSEHEKRTDGQKPELHTPRGGILHAISMADSLKYGQAPPMSDADRKIAAAAFMVANTLGGSGVVDQELLVEILRNPALIKSLTCPSQVPKAPAGDSRTNSLVNGNKVGMAGQPNENNQNLKRVVGEPFTSPLNRLQADYGGCLNAGSPSPVSVLQKLAEDPFINTSSKIPPNGSESTNVRHFTNVSSSMPSSLPSNLPERTYPLGGNALQQEVGAVHTWIQETSRGCNFSHRPFSCLNSQDPSLGRIKVERIPLAPVVCQNGFYKGQILKPGASGSMLSVEALQSSPSLNGELHQNNPLQGGLLFRSSGIDAGYKNFQIENTALGVFPKTGGRPKRLCMYFNTPRGCRNGGSCAFLHQSLNPELNAMAQ